MISTFRMLQNFVTNSLEVVCMYFVMYLGIEKNFVEGNSFVIVI